MNVIDEVYNSGNVRRLAVLCAYGLVWSARILSVKLEERWTRRMGKVKSKIQQKGIIIIINILHIMYQY
jgi:hypothetical protein